MMQERSDDLLKRKRILVMADWFVPGYRAGGPIRSVANFVEHMQDRYQLFVFTRDRDLHGTQPYEAVQTNKWLPYSRQAQVYYASPDQLSRTALLRIINSVGPDFIYLNSMFSFRFSLQVLLMRRFGKIRQAIVLAPRGMLRDSALAFKKGKKSLFLALCRLAKLTSLVRFHATDDTELKDIRFHLGRAARVLVIPNFPALSSAFPGIVSKIPGQLDIIFIGRLHPVKNLDWLITLLREVKANIHLTVLGNEEDQDYSNRCKKLALELPSNVQVQFLGERRHEELPAIIRQHHIMALPSQGENYGHAIFECLQQGRPVLISDQTPWRELESRQAGWDLPLNRPDLFQDRIREIAEWDNPQLENWAKAAWELAGKHSDSGSLKEKYSALFS